MLFETDAGVLFIANLPRTIQHNKNVLKKKTDRTSDQGEIYGTLISVKSTKKVAESTANYLRLLAPYSMKTGGVKFLGPLLRGSTVDLSLIHI